MSYKAREARAMGAYYLYVTEPQAEAQRSRSRFPPAFTTGGPR